MRVDLAKNGVAAGRTSRTEASPSSQTSFVIPRMLQSVISDGKKPEEAFTVAAEEINTIYKKYEQGCHGDRLLAGDDAGQQPASPPRPGHSPPAQRSVSAGLLALAS